MLPTSRGQRTPRQGVDELGNPRCRYPNLRKTSKHIVGYNKECPGDAYGLTDTCRLDQR